MCWLWSQYIGFYSPNANGYNLCVWMIDSGLVSSGIVDTQGQVMLAGMSGDFSDQLPLKYSSPWGLWDHAQQCIHPTPPNTQQPGATCLLMKGTMDARSTWLLDCKTWSCPLWTFWREVLVSRGSLLPTTTTLPGRKNWDHQGSAENIWCWEAIVFYLYVL